MIIQLKFSKSLVLEDCGDTLPEWEKDKPIGRTYLESEDEEEVIDEMEFDDEDSEEEGVHEEEKWSDLDNDEDETPASLARGKRKREEEDEEEEVMPTTGRSRRTNAGRKTEKYSPTKIAEEQRSHGSDATESSRQRRTDSRL